MGIMGYWGREFVPDLGYLDNHLNTFYKYIEAEQIRDLKTY